MKCALKLRETVRNRPVLEAYYILKAVCLALMFEDSRRPHDFAVVVVGCYLVAVVLVVDVVVVASSSMPLLLPQVRPWRGRGHEPHRGNLWNRGLSGELVPCEQAGLKIPLGDPTPEEFTSLFVPVSVSGMRRGRDR